MKERALRAGCLLIGLGLLGGLIYLWQMPCLILTCTGFACAGCGTQRMVTCLLKGDVQGAFFQNPFMFFVLPAGILYLLWEAFRYVRGESPLYKKRWVQAVMLALLILAVVFSVLRNLPGFEALGPQG